MYGRGLPRLKQIINFLKLKQHEKNFINFCSHDFHGIRFCSKGSEHSGDV